ncbi:hypothetical protein DEA8626_01551 [Defluviimonas aquaemixtae]|uniref:Peptidase M56 domain-containing protein n=1 Tax=Albidovulum aquaemixtae TaxID=1542388 RepID=A0A2R8B5V0_9RHOB|nr:M56 family metallopeptidase [Defluviimonas aquaemixtae]SPH18021.1 hypothetical protein DEA8626_01551 [Defluviimonas aquaemixtae]
MTIASALIDAYLDVNLLLVLVFALWLLAGRGLALVGLSHAVTARLRFLRALFLAVLLSPAFVALVSLGMRSGYVPADHAVNLSDFIVAQYLQGNIDMEASQVERLLGARGRVVDAMAGPVGQGLLAFLASGFLVCAIRLALGVVTLRGIVADSYAWRRIGRVELRLSDTVSVPFSTRGLRTRIVVLPSTMLANERDRGIALAHELQHLRQGDVEWEIALGLIRPFLFWNPAFYLWKARMEELRELSCDRQVMARRRYRVAEYCDCLLSVCHDGLRRRRLLSAGAPAVALVRTENWIFGGRSAALLKRRMMSVIEGRAERHPTVICAALTLPILALTLAASVAIQKPGDWSPDRIMLSTIVNLERLEAVNGPVPSFGSPGY